MKTSTRTSIVTNAIQDSIDTDSIVTLTADKDTANAVVWYNELQQYADEWTEAGIEDGVTTYEFWCDNWRVHLRVREPLH